MGLHSPERSKFLREEDADRRVPLNRNRGGKAEKSPREHPFQEGAGDGQNIRSESWRVDEGRLAQGDRLKGRIYIHGRTHQPSRYRIARSHGRLIGGFPWRIRVHKPRQTLHSQSWPEALFRRPGYSEEFPIGNSSEYPGRRKRASGHDWL